MTDLAQTNVQLLREVVDAGWSDDALRRLRAGYELARAYADERKAFGKPIAHFQAIAFMLADMATETAAARRLASVRRPPAPIATPSIASTASRAVRRC